jgi:GNAT superfamily N-acetyltransferase
MARQALQVSRGIHVGNTVATGHPVAQLYAESLNRSTMITLRETHPEKEDFLSLFETTGWNTEYEASADDLALALQNSWLTVAAYDEDRLVGFGRAVSDHVLHAMIYDMIVLPEYQGKGIGTMVLRRLVDRCHASGIKDIQLFCAKGKKGFYEKNGFLPRSDDAPGMQLKKENA